MKSKSLLSIIVFTLTLTVSLQGTGLVFQTFNPAQGDLLTSTGSFFAENTVISYGTLAGNLDSTNTTTFSAFSEYSSIFSPLTSSLINAAGETNAATSGQAEGTNYWLVIDTGSEQGAFFLGAAPALGSLGTAPIGGVAGYGNDSGVNLQAVPEPSSFALLAGCLGLAGVMLRRRR